MKESYGLKNIRDKIVLLENLYGKSIGFKMKNLRDSKGVFIRFVFPDFEQMKVDL